MTKKKGERLMEEVEQNHSEAAKRVEEEIMNLQEIIASVSRSPMKCNHLLIRFSQTYAYCCEAQVHTHLPNFISSCDVWCVVCGMIYGHYLLHILI